MGALSKPQYVAVNTRNPESGTGQPECQWLDAINMCRTGAEIGVLVA